MTSQLRETVNVCRNIESLDERIKSVVSRSDGTIEINVWGYCEEIREKVMRYFSINDLFDKCVRIDWNEVSYD